MERSTRTSFLSILMKAVVLGCLLASAACAPRKLLGVNVYEPRASVGFGVQRSNLGSQFEDTFKNDFTQFNPQIKLDDITSLFQLALDFGVLRHDDHRKIDLHFGGGIDLAGLETMFGEANSSSVTVTRSGESRINRYFLRSGPSFELAEFLRLWAFYEKSLTDSEGTFGDKAVVRTTQQQIQGGETDSARIRRQHAAIGLQVIAELYERQNLTAGFEWKYSNNRFVHPNNRAEVGNHARTSTFVFTIGKTLW